MTDQPKCPVCLALPSIECPACNGTGEAHWQQRSGKIPVSEMTHLHITNCLRALRRQGYVRADTYEELPAELKEECWPSPWFQIFDDELKRRSHWR